MIRSLSILTFIMSEPGLRTLDVSQPCFRTPADVFRRLAGLLGHRDRETARARQRDSTLSLLKRFWWPGTCAIHTVRESYRAAPSDPFLLGDKTRTVNHEDGFREYDQGGVIARPDVLKSAYPAEPRRVASQHFFFALALY
jgi:hypothetical protein